MEKAPGETLLSVSVLPVMEAEDREGGSIKTRKRGPFPPTPTRGLDMASGLCRNKDRDQTPVRGRCLVRCRGPDSEGSRG